MQNKTTRRKFLSSMFAAFYATWTVQSAAGYAFNQVVPDVRQPVAMSGGSACPVRAHQLTASSIPVRWSTALGTNPVSILTQNQSAAARLTEIEQVITQSLAVWTGVTGTTLLPITITPPQRVATQTACGSDGLNSICFDQADMAFTPGVLAFTRVITSDALDEHIGSSPAATQLGQILDADIYFDPPTCKSLSPRPPRCPPRPKPTISNPSSPTSSAIFSASATPPSGAP
jgi:hypothetical protein